MALAPEKAFQLKLSLLGVPKVEQHIVRKADGVSVVHALKADVRALLGILEGQSVVSARVAAQFRADKVRVARVLPIIFQSLADPASCLVA